MPEDYAEKLFAQKFNDAKRKAAIDDLQKTIRILKFYSNNDFAFKDVHNEDLFFQNGKILVEVVQLFQKYRIVYPSKHQFLGDLFEQLLNKGFKQNEGQFFTPTPITRFIWDCLPMDKIVRNGENFTIPKVIDYACGAGHFLTEAVEAVNAYFETNNYSAATANNAWCEHHIFGVEKDYRLARVARVSLYMNGAGQGKIIFGDGLEQYTEKEITNGTFDVLVANPPYSVSGFKAHLKLKNNHFELLERNLISNDGSEIETLFVERIAQLLKPKGVAAVVLPSSILSNDSNSYMAAREILLQNFLLRAAAQFGSKTFGATSTSTVVLFLEKYNEPPKRREIVNDSVTAILSGDFTDEWEDIDIFRRYVLTIGVTEEQYRNFAKEKALKDDLKQIEYFAQYIVWFDNLTEVQTKLKSNKFNKLSKEEQQKEIKDLFFKKVKEVESEKLMYFALGYNQTTLTIMAPSDNAEQKKFLGYDWSNRKGAEGIQITSPGGMLYNNCDRYATNTLAAAVRNSFSDKQIALSEPLNNYCGYLCTQDMLDFSRTTFNKAIKLTINKKIGITSKYSLEKLGDIAPYSTKRIKSSDIKVCDYITTDNMLQQMRGIKDYEGEMNFDTAVDYQTNDILLSNIRPYFKKIWLADKNGGCSPDVLVFRVTDKEKVNPKYLFETLCASPFFDFVMSTHTGTKMPRGDKNIIPMFKVPIPPLDIQKQIVSECEKVDDEYIKGQKNINDSRNKIEECFVSLDKKSNKSLKLSNKEIFDISIGRRILNSEVSSEYDIPVFSANVYEPFGMINKLLINDFSVPSVLWGIDGDWMVNTIEANRKFYPTDHCGVLRIKTNDVLPRYAAWLLEREGKKVGFKRSYRASIDRIESLSIPVAPIEDQKRIVSEIEKYEAKIEEAKAIMAGCGERKKEILRKYLE